MIDELTVRYEPQQRFISKNGDSNTNTISSPSRNITFELSKQDRSILEQIASSLATLAAKQTPSQPTIPSSTEIQPDLGQSAETLIPDLWEMLEGRFNSIEERITQITIPAPETANKNLYTIEEAAEITKLSRYTLRKACNTGRIKGAEKGDDRRWRISHTILERIQEQGLPAP